VIADAISQKLAGRIHDLARALLPGGRRAGNEWRCGSVWGEPGVSLGVHLSGSKAGVWADFASGESGDALDLVRAVHGFDVREALAWSWRWLGMDDGEAARPPFPARKPHANSDFWRRIWEETKPIAGTIAAQYLASRGLPLPDDDEAIRFHPRCPFKGQRAPAMVG
jgi:hypothetical protein